MMMTILPKRGVDRLDWETATKRAGPIVDLFGTDREGSYGVGDVFFCEVGHHLADLVKSNDESCYLAFHMLTGSS